MKVRNSGGRSAGLSLIELLIVVAVLMTLMALAIPRMLQARMLANEASAVASLRTIATVQVTYDSTYQRGYAPGLPALGPPSGGGAASASGAGLIDNVLSMGAKSGYIFLYTAIDANSDGKPEAFTINANPTTPGASGMKYFYVDQSNVIRFSITGPANSSSSPVPQN